MYVSDWNDSQRIADGNLRMFMTRKEEDEIIDNEGGFRAKGVKMR